jgi:uncharacterized membrane protein YfcA
VYYNAPNIYLEKRNFVRDLAQASYRNRLFLSVLFVWTILFLLSGNKLELVSNYGYFFLVGIVGAVVANSTGAGGGIIFIPFFTALGLGENETLGTSILIQCFGMTAGSISWLTTSHIIKANSHHLNRLIFQLLVICGCSSIVGVLTGQYILVPDDASLMIDSFRLFSIVFGLILLFFTLNSHKQRHTQFDLVNADIVLFIITGFIGGLITAWISVGIGEFVALVLILRRYPTMVAISMGVVVTAISVLSAAYYHVSVIDSVNWSIILFAVPGAIIGGTLAYLLSEKLGPIRLKIFFSIWIILTGLLMQ